MNQKLYTTFSFFKQFLALSALVCAGLGAAWLAGFREWLVPGLLLLIFATALMAFRILQLIYRLQLDRVHDVNQIDALLWNYAQFVPGIKLPTMRIHAGSPDFLSVIIEQVQRHQPQVIVEAGSGVSSVVISELLLSQQSPARHYALDHETQYADETRRKVRNPNSEVLYAPLRAYPINGKTWQWYDCDPLANVQQIDMLVIDGPPEHLQPLARYPALPLLLAQLSPNAIVIADDTIRADDAETVRRWAAEFGFEVEHVRTEKGTCILTRKKG